MAGTTLVKDKSYTFVPDTSGTSAIPGVPNTPGTPGHYSTKLVTVTSCLPTICNNVSPGSTTPVGSSLNTGGYNQQAPCSRAMVCSSSLERVSIYHPPTPGTPGETGTPGTSVSSVQLIEHLNEGWNSYSRSVDELTLRKFVKYKVSAGAGGVMISIGVKGMEKVKTNKFSHSILLETAGVIVFENGKQKSIVKNFYSKDSEVSLYRQSDNRIVCIVKTGPETLAHVFENVGHSSPLIPLYVYANLYIADDAVEDADFKEGEVSFGKV